MGTAHPRRIGIASHMGLVAGAPDHRVGKNAARRQQRAALREKGAHVPLVDRGETIGAVVRTRTGKHPLFISPGHLADIPSAVELVLACSPKTACRSRSALAHKAAGFLIALFWGNYDAPHAEVPRACAASKHAATRVPWQRSLGDNVAARFELLSSSSA